jgi:glucose/arabinose dehydrogenase
MGACNRDAPAPSNQCDRGNGGITLPAGFCASVFADEVGVARHLVVTSNGDVYVALEDGSQSSANSTKMHGDKGRGGIMALRDTNSDGRADIKLRVGDIGGSGIALDSSSLYFSSPTSVFRYKLEPGRLAPTSGPDTIVTGFPDTGGHSSHSLALDGAGNVFVNVGSDTNACRGTGNSENPQGLNPCPELEIRAGIWRYDSKRLGQLHDVSQRHATGIRNAVGLVWNEAAHALYATQHGRDGLRQRWPKLYSAEKGDDTPSEEVMKVEAGNDFGWPYCYHDREMNRRVLAPEYGGDARSAGRCANKALPILAFPGHWGPDGLMFYKGAQFPARFRNGAFISFHGSWNRVGRQEGYKVVFVPFSGGSPSGAPETFADGFAGRRMNPGGARHRPVGIAEGPDGSLYISDDQNGRIWRIIYVGTSSPNN